MEIMDELGLSGNEAKVYESLIQFGKLSASEVSGKSGVSYSRIYDVLDSLTNKGLVEVVPEKTKKFVAGSPDAFLELVNRKERILEKAKEKVKEMKRFYDVKEKNPVIVNVGRSGFYKTVKELSEPKKYEYIIKWVSEYRPEWERKTRENMKKGVDLKVLARYDSETEKNVKRQMKVNKNYRKFDNEGVAFSVADDKEVMLSLIKSNVTLLIKDKAFAKIMKKMFLETYGAAEKI